MTIFDQNKSISEASSVKFLLEEDKIKVLFSNNFPSSIRVNGLGRRDHYPFFIPVIDLFNSLQNLNLQGTILGTGCYENIKLGNTLSITGDGGNAWGYLDLLIKNLLQA